MYRRGILCMFLVLMVVSCASHSETQLASPEAPPMITGFVPAEDFFPEDDPFAMYSDFFFPTQTYLTLDIVEDGSTMDMNVYVRGDGNFFIHKTGYYTDASGNWQSFTLSSDVTQTGDWTTDWVKGEASGSISDLVVASYGSPGYVAVYFCKEYSWAQLSTSPVVSSLSYSELAQLQQSFGGDEYRYFCGLREVTGIGLDEQNWALRPFSSSIGTCISTCEGSGYLCDGDILKDCQEISTNCKQYVSTDCEARGGVCDPLFDTCQCSGVPCPDEPADLTLNLTWVDATDVLEEKWCNDGGEFSDDFIVQYDINPSVRGTDQTVVNLTLDVLGYPYAYYPTSRGLALQYNMTPSPALLDSLQTGDCVTRKEETLILPMRAVLSNTYTNITTIIDAADAVDESEETNNIDSVKICKGDNCLVVDPSNP